MIVKCKKCSMNENCICIPSADECHIRKEAYNKAIQDFYDKVLNFEDYIEPLDVSLSGTTLLYAGYDITNMIAQIKNELQCYTDC